MPDLQEIFFYLGAYLLGSIPFGFIIFYLSEKKDIRKEGSGNIGATNVLRTKGKVMASVTLLGDMLKGAIPVIYGMHHFHSPVVIFTGGCLAVLGHLFPAYLKFKGGKGVASFAGLFIVFDLLGAMVFLVVFLLVFALTRYVSAGSMAGVTSVFFYTLLTGIVEVSAVLFVLSVLIIIKHSSNISRLAAGCENKFIWKKNG